MKIEIMQERIDNIDVFKSKLIKYLDQRYTDELNAIEDEVQAMSQRIQTDIQEAKENHR